MNVEKVEEKRDYNPFEHRQVKKPTSDIRSAANLIKASLGSGLLAGPLAFSNAGWGVGLFGTLLVGVICGHCIHILVRISQECCVLEKKPSLGYAETCKSAFMNGPKGMRKFATFASIFAEFALLFTYAGVCCIYTVLISDSVKQLVERFAPSTILPVEYYCLIFLVPIILLCQIRYLKFLAIFSGIANILLFTVYIICLYYIFGGDISFEGKHAAGDPARYPAFLSTVIFAMEGVGVVMPIENTMKKPQNFLGCPSVLVVAMTAIVFLYGTLGTFGYLRYGDVLRGSITLNLPTEEWPAVLAKVSIALSIFLTYPLQFYVVIDIFTRYTQHHIKQNYRQITQIAARTVGVCICVGIGMALPLLEQILNIVGALFYSILGLIIPSVIETVFRWDNLGKWNWILWKNAFICLFGLLCLVSGCTVTIMDIIEILHRKTETVIFAMEGVGVVMPIENTMKKPQNFLGCPSVLVVAMTAIVFLYGTLGTFGYLRYGDVLRGSITLNLPTEEWPAVLAKVSIALSIFLTYPLQFYVVIDIFTRYTQHHIKQNYRQITQIAARTVGVCICVGIGMALPLLEQILNIVGALFYSILGLIIPSVIETVFRWDNLGKWNWILWKNAFICLFGLLCLVSGCTVTIMDIIEILHRKTE